MNDVSSFLLRGIPPEMVETFTDLVFSADGSDSEALLEQLFLDGVSAETIMLNLLAPSARSIGDLWCCDRLNFVEVTFGLSRLHRLLRQFRASVGGQPTTRGKALLVPVPGEQHTFGLRIVEEFLLRDGWNISSSLSASRAEIMQLVAAHAYDFVGLSISGERLLPALRSAIPDIRAASRNRDIRIMVGGVLFAGASCSTDLSEADAVVSDAEGAVAQANQWFALAGVA